VCETYSNKNVDKHDVTLKCISHISSIITQVTVHCFRIISCTWRNFRKCDCSLCPQRLCQYTEKCYCFLTGCVRSVNVLLAHTTTWILYSINFTSHAWGKWYIY